MSTDTATTGNLAVGSIEIETDRADLDAIGEGMRLQADVERLAHVNRWRTILEHRASKGQETLAGWIIDAFPGATADQVLFVLQGHRRTHAGHREHLKKLRQAVEAGNDEAVALLSKGKA